MAKLICSDGTEVEISAETEANLREKFGKPEKKFEPITVCCIEVSVSPGGSNISIKDVGEGRQGCIQTSSEAWHTIRALESAIDYIEKK